MLQEAFYDGNELEVGYSYIIDSCFLRPRIFWL